MTSKYALLIGNSRYEDPGLAGLKAPDADVCAFESILRSPDICEFSDVVTLLDQGLADVLRQITKFYGRRRRDDLLLLYFSGHGVKDDAGQLYLAVRDTDRALLAGTAVPSHFISSQMDASSSRSLVLMLDCCNSGAFAAGSKSAPGMDTRSAFEGNGAGRIVLTATDSTQYAWEGDRVIAGDEVENSLFTHFIVEGLRTGAADRDEDGFINVDELYDYVFEQIQQRTHKQTPKKCVYNAHGEFRIAKNCSPKAAALPENLVEELESPIRGVALEAIPKVEIHLKNIKRMAAAERALERLKTDHDSNKVRHGAAAALKRHSAWKLFESEQLTAALAEIRLAIELEGDHRLAIGLRDKIMQAIVEERREAIAAVAAEVQACLASDNIVAAAAALDQPGKQFSDAPELAALREQVRTRLEERRIRDEQVTAHLDAARAALAAERFDEAGSCLQKAAGLNPDAAGLADLRVAVEHGARFRQIDKLLDKAESLRRTDLEMALIVVQSAHHLAPDYPRAIALHGEIVAAIIVAAAADVEMLLSSGDDGLDRAVVTLTRIDSDLKRPKELDAMRDRVNFALEQRRLRDAAVDACCAAVRSAIDAGRFEDAFRALSKALALNPQAPGIAELHRAATTAQAAAVAAERQRRIEEMLAAADALRASDLRAALTAVESALMEDPAYPGALDMRATLSAALEAKRRQERELNAVVHEFNGYLAQGALDAAAQALATAEPGLHLALEPYRHELIEKLRLRDEEVARLLAAARTAIDDRRFDDAFGALDSASRLNANAEGLAELRDAASVDRDIEFLFREAETLFSRGDLDAAAAGVEEALRRNPRHGAARGLKKAVAAQIRERLEIEQQIEAEKTAAEKREAERLASEKREAEKLAAEKRKADRLAAAREAQRLAAEKRQAEKLAAAKEAERRAVAKREAERLAAEREAERLAAEQREAERQATEKREAEIFAATAIEQIERNLPSDERGSRADVRSDLGTKRTREAEAPIGLGVLTDTPSELGVRDGIATPRLRRLGGLNWLKFAAPLALVAVIGVATQWGTSEDVSAPTKPVPAAPLPEVVLPSAPPIVTEAAPTPSVAGPRDASTGPPAAPVKIPAVEPTRRSQPNPIRPVEPASSVKAPATSDKSPTPALALHLRRHWRWR